MGAILWALMMLAWLAGLLHGLWWVWPHFERMTPERRSRGGLQTMITFVRL
jgi:hypothetical protein